MELDDLKLELFDSIADAKNSNDIINIKKEADAVYEKLMLTSQIDGVFNPYLFQSQVYTAISSYYYNPNFNLEDRLPIIDGMIFYNSVFSEYNDIMKNLEKIDQIAFCLKLFNNYQSDIVLTKKVEQNIGLGIAISANLYNISKRK